MKRSRRILRPLVILLVGLAVVTIGYRYVSHQNRYQLQVFSSPTGWGYAVVNNGKTLIYQPTVPGQAGNKGFANEALARRVGERIITKLRQGQFPPTITPEELTQLGVPVY